MFWSGKDIHTAHYCWPEFFRTVQNQILNHFYSGQTRLRYTKKYIYRYTGITQRYPERTNKLFLTPKQSCKKSIAVGLLSLPFQEKWSTSPTSEKGKRSTTSILRLIQIHLFMQNISSKLNLQHWLRQTRRAGSAALHKASL